MKIRQFFALLLTLGIAMFQLNAANAQNKLPVIRSGVADISIRDGRQLSKNSWHLNPQTKPDVYFVQVPRGNRKVTFISDRDSISFVPSFGKIYDFVVLLNGKDSCLTRISANYDGALPHEGKTVIDTIPFTMKNSRIYFKGKLNGRKDFNIMFDLGAGMTCINSQAAARSGIRFDDKIRVQNTSGTNSEPSGSSNTLELGRLKWQKVPIVQVRNLAEGEDMIIGNTLFRDKIVEIDYEKKIVILSDSLSKNTAGYSAYDVTYYQQRPLFEINVKIGSRYYPFHFLFDTGRDGTMLIGEDFTAQYGLWDQYRSILTLGNKKIVVIPEVRIGNRVFREIVTNANDPQHPNGKQSLIGNEVLNQFNVILDNQQGIIYLKPNSLQNENYATYREFKLQAALVITAIIIGIGLVVFVWRQWLKYKKAKRSKKNL
ncbi:pepsin/retropepsin-like aspartic protease family protein [Mucilaginibacter sp. KACC 22063]|uniref:pepsin/retropepsin-like aspartic protease family protein n=1 Tax=Mucilaginibacter sp. KACC 22063 TaxID=3025666 RepID=UPI00236706B6|nr:pepsin/retropepsin-like aspartic protease family protein [Mucilaginibacter sp. KACC 22063]WDF57171.1 pepsin/retropepsin-like aspartic protease family protein [Mucilaginibacter sp. KACC 22063]